MYDIPANSPNTNPSYKSSTMSFKMILRSSSDSFNHSRSAFIKHNTVKYIEVLRWFGHTSNINIYGNVQF